MGARVEVGVLGPVALWLDGEAVPLPGTPQRVLLARLALAAGRVVTVDALVDALWADDPPGNALGNLHSYVSRLRRLTGPGPIRRVAAGYRLDLPPVATDAGRVERLAAAAERQGPAEAAETLSAAVAAWRGDPLADLADRPAFAPDIARLAEWRRHLGEECLDRRLAAGQAARALPRIQELAAAEPLRERPQLLLMRALHQTGRTAQALEVARAYRDRVVEGYGIDPGPALDELRARILADDPAVRPVTGAPQPRRPGDRFFGREDELAALDRYAERHRVVTVAGPGGVGKTRLVTEALRGGDLVVELAELAGPAGVPGAVAGALGLRSAPRGGAEAIVERLGSQPARLVLDNCEHVLDAVRELVEVLVSRCPRVHIVATSRRPLGVAGERVLRLGPLPAADRVDLFCDRAALLRAGFEASPAHRSLAAEVCELVDGLPLAVELAARREAVFGLAQLRDRLGAGLGVLDPARGGNRSNAVRATVEWSYRLLAPEAQALLDRLCVCVGGFGLDALRYFAADADRLLAELADASLVVCDLAADPPRYRLLETVRHVGLAHLGPGGDDEAREAHARWMADHAARLVEGQRVRAPGTTAALRRELANAQEALGWLVRRERWDEAALLAARLAAVAGADPDPGLTEQLRRLAPPGVHSETDALLAFAAGAAEVMLNHFADADRLLRAAFGALPPGHPLRWSVPAYRVSNAMFQGDADDVRAIAGDLAREPGAPVWCRALGVCCAALMDAYAGDAAAGHRRLEEHAHLLATDLDGFVAFTRGELAAGADPEAALACFEASLRISDRIGQTYIGNIARVARASVLIRLRRHAEAAAACREVLAAVRAAGMTAQIWTTLRLTAELLGDAGDLGTAVAILAAADRDPLAPAVMGADLPRHAALRRRAGAAGITTPIGYADSAATAALATEALDRLLGK